MPRPLKAKPGQIKIGWSIPQGGGKPPSLCVSWGGDGAEQNDALLVLRALNAKLTGPDMTILDELKVRGYDITTLKFSIDKVKGK